MSFNSLLLHKQYLSSQSFLFQFLSFFFAFIASYKVKVLSEKKPKHVDSVKGHWDPKEREINSTTLGTTEATLHNQIQIFFLFFLSMHFSYIMKLKTRY